MSAIRALPLEPRKPNQPTRFRGVPSEQVHRGACRPRFFCHLPAPRPALSKRRTPPPRPLGARTCTINGRNLGQNRPIPLSTPADHFIVLVSTSARVLRRSRGSTGRGKRYAGELPPFLLTPCPRAPAFEPAAFPRSARRRSSVTFPPCRPIRRLQSRISMIGLKARGYLSTRQADGRGRTFFASAPSGGFYPEAHAGAHGGDTRILEEWT